FFEPGAFNREGFAAGNTFDAQSNAIHFRRLESINEKARKNILHRDSDGESVGRKRIAGCKSIFDLNWRVTLQPDFAGQMKCSALAVQGILRQSTKRRD